MAGFGWFEASEYVPQEDSSAWLIQGILPKNSFGFIAGPAKGNASPFGGKSVLQRKMALCLITGQPFFGFQVSNLKKRKVPNGRVLFVNLDEGQDKQVRLYYRMTRGEKILGYLISRAHSCRFPEQIYLLEQDIKECDPDVVYVDPLQRVLGSRAVKNQEDVGPIINALKRLSREYECSIAVSHHSNKSPERDKDSTSSWLSGSVDLDAAWDFCLCLEYSKHLNAMHLRNFQKEKAKTDLYYEAEIVNSDEIVDLLPIHAWLMESQQARKIYSHLVKNPGHRECAVGLRKLAEILCLAESSLRYQMDRYSELKKLYCELPQPINLNEDNHNNE